MGSASGRMLTAALAALLVLLPSPASAHRFNKVLSFHSKSGDVRALEMRIAGWYPAHTQKLLRVDRYFGHRTTVAVKNFQRRFGLAVDGVAGPQTFSVLNRLEKKDGSTQHFSYAEFWQHKNRSCSRRANRYAGTFKGGEVPARAVKRHVRQMMWRLEAVRSKAHRPVIVESGFRSVPYNRCIGGATASQHLYGYAADVRIPGLSGEREREIYKRSQIHGVLCYSSSRHTHIDLRLDNRALPYLHQWWWPDRDVRGNHLTPDGSRCYGE